MYARIPLTRGKFALVDAADHPTLSQYKWHCTSYGYAAGYINGKLTYMHRFILDAPSDKLVDHIDGDKLNNTRANLRLATDAQNQWNRRKTNTYKGVSFHKQKQKYYARIQVNGKQIFLGYFAYAHDAAEAYDKAARKYFGEFARTNFAGERIYR